MRLLPSRMAGCPHHSDVCGQQQGREDYVNVESRPMALCQANDIGTCVDMQKAPQTARTT